MRYDCFLAMDKNHDGSIGRQEFIDGWWKQSPAEDVFALIDRDQNGRVSYEEYSHPLSPTFFDPIEWFRAADTNLDARLNHEELSSAVELGRKHLVSSAIRSFDDDQDGELSLSEYRASMLGSYNYPWDHRPVDQDRDGRLSYDEFVFAEVDLFQLQRWYFFHRLDLDQDGGLSLEEFEFRRLAPLSIRAYSTESDHSKLVYQASAHLDCGWPSLSPDGRQLLLHEYPPGGPREEGRIVSVSLDEDQVRTVCSGKNPSWSADGAQFVCERRLEGSEIWILDAGGLRGRRVADGHGPKWSPDGTSIAFLQDNGVSIFDVKTEKIRPVLLREDHPYQDLGSDIAWSPDGRRVAVLGNFAATSQLLILSVSPDQPVQVHIRSSFSVGCQSNLNWNHRDGITLGIRDLESRETRLMSVIPDTDQLPKRADRFDRIAGVRSACLTPDGKWYISVVEE